eukprot:s317_g33.t1
MTCRHLRRRQNGGTNSPSAAFHFLIFFGSRAPAAVVQLPCGTMDWDYLSGFVLFCLFLSVIFAILGQVGRQNGAIKQ